MTEQQRLLRAIETEPDDDTVRLVYADWCEENGDQDRAEFIRLQCEYFRLYGGRTALEGTESQARSQMDLRIDALLKANWAGWTDRLPAWAREVKFERGFPNVFMLTGKQFLDSAAAIRAVTVLDTLNLRLLKGREQAVFASDQLNGVRWLWMDDAQLTDAGVGFLTNSPYLKGVFRLWLNRNSYGDAKDANKLTDHAAIALAQARNLPALIELEFDGYKKITPAGIRALVESEARGELEKLSIDDGPGGTEVAEAFRSSRCRLTKLKTLSLCNRKLGDAGASVLAEANTLSEIQELHLARNKIRDRGAAALANSPYLAKLTYLNLCENALTDTGVRSLLASPHLRGIRSLYLSGNPRLTHSTAEAILADGRPWNKIGLDYTEVSSVLWDQIAALCQR